MPMQGEAKAAMKALNGKEFDGSKIRVKKAEIKVMIEEGDDSENKNENIPSESVWSKKTKN